MYNKRKLLQVQESSKTPNQHQNPSQPYKPTKPFPSNNLQMLQPTSLIFPSPLHQQPLQKILQLNAKLLYIQKDKQSRKDLNWIRKQSMDGQFKARSMEDSSKVSKGRMIKLGHAPKVNGKQVPQANKIFDNRMTTNNKQKIIHQNLSIKLPLETNINKIKIASSALSGRIPLTPYRKHSYTSSLATTSRSSKPKKQFIKANPLQKFQSDHPLRQSLPCLFLSSPSNHPSKLLLYYHANGQDLLNCYPFIKTMQRSMGINILVVEYPGYTVYDKGQDEIVVGIKQDVGVVMDYLEKQGYLPKDLFVVGRSIGTGPALYLANHYQVAGLLLISPFSNFKNLVNDLYGSFASYLIKQIFDNQRACQQIQCPVLIVHGLQDKLINYNHSLALTSKIKSFCSFKLIQNMTHSRFSYQKDLLVHLDLFLQLIQFH